MVYTDNQKPNTVRLFWIAAILLPWAWLWPAVMHPSFSMIDNPIDFETFRVMEQDFGKWWKESGFRGEEELGRLRPVYWLCRYAFHAWLLPVFYNPEHPELFQPRMWQVAHYVLLVLNLSALFFLVRRLSGKAGYAFLGCALWIFNAKTMENFTRLATSEVWQLLWLNACAVLIYLFFQPYRKKHHRLIMGAVFFFTFLAYFTKETSVLLFPITGVLWLGSLILNRGRYFWSRYLIWNLFMLFLQRLLSPPMTGYASAFVLSGAVMGENILRYLTRLQWLYLVLPLLISYGIRVARRVFNKGFYRIQRYELWQAGLLVAAAAFFAILLPWKRAEPRYLLVTDYFLAFFMAMELGVLYPLMRERFMKLADLPALLARTLFFAVFLVGAGVLAYASRAQLLLELQYTYAMAGKPTPAQALSWLSRRAPHGSNVLLLYTERELVRSSAIYVQDLYGREDITLYTASPHVPELRKQGYNVEPVRDGGWPEALEQADYIFWNHRGVKKVPIDLFHKQIMDRVLQSEYGTGLEKIYDTLHRPMGLQIPEGTEIWRINHEKIDAARRLQAKENASSRP